MASGRSCLRAQRCALLCIALLAAAPLAAEQTPDTTHARRIVSLDYCADQFVLRFATPSRILAVSPDADADFSYMRASAQGLRKVRPVAEDVLVLRPDLVVRSYGGGPYVGHLFARAGVPVIQIGFPADIDDVRTTIRHVSRGLGAAAQGEAVIADMDARMARVRRQRDETALYFTPSGITSGPGTLVHRLMEAAGLDNFQTAPGWRPIPLERMAYEGPDLIAAATFGGTRSHLDAWTAARHPVARRHLRARPVVELEGAWTSCGGWFLVDAIEALASAPDRP